MKVIKHKNNKNFDRLTYVTGILLPILTIPQAYTILISKETEGVSLLTWTFYLFASALFAVYGVIHKEKLLMFTYIPFTIVETAIVIGLLLY